VALVAAWHETDPDAPVDFLRLPLLGVTRVPVTARPGARVRVRVDPDTFGPVTADRRGRAEVTVRVPPGVTRCDVIVKERRRPELTRQVPVEVPPYNRLTAAIVPYAVFAGGKAEARLEVLYDLGGAEVSPDRIQVTPSAGSVTFRHGSRGRYTFRVLPPPGAAAGGVSFAVSVTGDPTARATAQLRVSSPPPARLVVTPPARALRAGSSGPSTVDVLVVDASGAGLPGLDVSATANGEPLPPATSRGDGHYELRLAAPQAVPPGGAVVIEAIAHHPDSFAFGTAKWQVEPPPPPSLPPAPPPPALVALASAGGARDRERGLREPGCVVLDGDRSRRMTDGSAAFDRSFSPAFRRSSGRVLAGATAGYTRSPGVASGPRAGAELWVPFQVGEFRLGAGLSAGLGTAARTVSDRTGALRSTIEATFVPVALKLGVEAWATRRLSVHAGAGPLAAWARFQSSLASGAEQGLALGWTSFVDAGWSAGPGVLVLGLAYGSAVVTTTDYRVDPGGLSVAAGYRMRVF
jgi:hypothetical protein